MAAAIGDARCVPAAGSLVILLTLCKLVGDGAEDTRAPTRAAVERCHARQQLVKLQAAAQATGTGGQVPPLRELFAQRAAGRRQHVDHVVLGLGPWIAMP